MAALFLLRSASVLGLALLAAAGALPQASQAPPGSTSEVSSLPPRYPAYEDWSQGPAAMPHPAPEMRITADVSGPHGADVPGLSPTDFVLTVNGKPRAVTFVDRSAAGSSPGSRTLASASGPESVPVVLMVVPPNQPVVRWIALRDGLRYFTQQPADANGNLSWSVSLLDSDGSQSPYSRNKQEVLAAFEKASQHPSALLAAAGKGQEWESKAQRDVAEQRYLSPARIVIVCNPVADVDFSQADWFSLRTSPEDLVSAALQAGSRIFVLNSGGPEPAVPASRARGGNYMQNASIALMAKASAMWSTADATGGGFANSLAGLTPQIEQRLASSYVLQFHLTGDEIERGSPEIAVRAAAGNLRVKAGEPYAAPTMRLAATSGRPPGKQMAVAAYQKAIGRPMSSRLLHIDQRVEFFPMGKDDSPLLPAICTVAWTGGADVPDGLYVMERLETEGTGTVIQEDRMTIDWNGRSASWERDNRLPPGAYVWRVAAGDASGGVIGSQSYKFKVELPAGARAELSSLAVGDRCSAQAQPPGLRVRGNSAGAPSEFDPLRMEGCRLAPRASAVYERHENLIALVRVYLSAKADQGSLSRWQGSYSLADAAGHEVAQQPVELQVDSQPGYFAALRLPLASAAIPPGEYTLSFSLHGPGIKKELRESQALEVR